MNWWYYTFVANFRIDQTITCCTVSIAYAMSFQTGKRCNDANALLAQTLSWIELHMNSHFKFLRFGNTKCLRFGNIKRYDAENCVSMNSCFKLLSDAMIQFHTNAFAFVRKKHYKHHIIGHAKHTYPQISSWNMDLKMYCDLFHTAINSTCIWSYSAISCAYASINSWFSWVNDMCHCEILKGCNHLESHICIRIGNEKCYAAVSYWRYTYMNFRWN